jgi:hypothetical protein
MEFIKKQWKVIAGFVLGAVGFVLLIIFGKKNQPVLPVTPTVPNLDDVKIPDVNVNVSDDYVANKEPVTTDKASVIDEINARHK